MSNLYTKVSKNTPLKVLGEVDLRAQIMDYAYRGEYHTRMDNAITLAAFAHRGQLRANRSTLPRDTYLTHPLRGALRLLRAGVQAQDVIIATVLHDVLEDATDKLIEAHIFEVQRPLDKTRFGIETANRDGGFYFLGREFGYGVARNVLAVSTPVYEERPAKDERISKYLEHLEEVFSKPEPALIKITDLIDNGAGLYHNTGMTDGAFKYLARKYLKAMPMALDALHTAEVQKYFNSVPGYLDIEKKLVKGIERLENLTLDI